jgi:hypothetical protein
MVYRVYSNHINDYPTHTAVQSWYRDGIINIPVDTHTLSRNLDGLPFLKDILEKGVERCVNDDDVIIYTNTDIFLVEDDIVFPKTQFFCVRKNVTDVKIYTEADVSKMSYEYSVNCDVFGFTKKCITIN